MVRAHRNGGSNYELWNELFEELMRHLASRVRSRSVILARRRRDGKLKMNVRKIAATIRSDRRLLELYLAAAKADGFPPDHALEYMPYILRSKLLALYKVGIEPTRTFVEIILARGYVLLEELRRLAGGGAAQKAPANAGE